MPRPLPGEAAPFYHRYIELVSGDNIAAVIAQHQQELHDFYNALPEEKAAFSYAPGKWTVKEVLLHVTDAERVFSYRAMRIARKDKTPLPGFDENSFAANSLAAGRTLAALKEEWNAVRTATTLLLQSFNEMQLQETGTSSNNLVSVNALCFLTYGHQLHHKKILEERYL